ncbi:MAG: glycosyltransferase family 1 protein [Candidatus Mcinerneyibacterium aminivorans]|uniref:Glycosyltransferase family 1 protein n=1 Tax=Candidatus Mcinerneyibacterium aminivorans TaxID=2703815 RepID=A0A5D0MGB7_9BACT|nr:MAG: glycosyltransferase family 1 protein [Candidatus Mcinerneyibacterium aminivorans]
MRLKDIYIKPKIPKKLEKLFELSYNVWTTWDKDAVNLFLRIDPNLFRKLNFNPVEFLHKIEYEKLQKLAEDKGFLYELKNVWDKFSQYKKYRGYYMDKNDNKIYFDKGDLIAYFSMEYGLHESLPLYSGGLGVLAGDFIKSASDMGMPIVGFGLLYKYGYLNQYINEEGYQEEEYVENRWYLKPIKEVRDKENKPITFEMKIKNYKVNVKLWKIEVGKIPLYFLDTDIATNSEYVKSITDYLYVADRDKRIEQEILLGQGAIQAIKILNIEPKIYHLNEGHSAFLIIERLKKMMMEDKLSYEATKQIIRESTVFTTHTPVIEGNEHFDKDKITTYIKDDIEKLEIKIDTFLVNGLIENSTKFWLPALALKFSKYSNAVSKLHQEVSKKMWKEIYGELDYSEIPIDYITNGVHIQSWLSNEMARIFDRYIGPDYLHMADKSLWEQIEDIPDDEIWAVHKTRKEHLISFIRNRIVDKLEARGAPSTKISELSNILNPEYLTIAFARRFATYKRANLILHDKERLKKILTNGKKPVQLIFAGKAHSADKMGKELIKEIIDFAKEYDLEDKVVFLENYDINVARHLVQGVDVWLNTPLKHMEASGTSGMKAGINGVLNLSVLDGWWPEGYNGENGWAITAGERYQNIDMKNETEANQIYSLLEEEITEIYYDKTGAYYPKNWVKKMKKSIYSICKDFNMHRMLDEYFYKSYYPAMSQIDLLEESNHKEIDEYVKQKDIIKEKWSKLYIKFIDSEFEKKDVSTGENAKIDAYVYLDNIDPSLISVEIFYKYDENGYKVIDMEFLEKYEDSILKFTADVEVKGYGLEQYNVRIRPSHDMLFESNPEFVKWYFE